MPILNHSDRLQCVFGTFASVAVATRVDGRMQVTCSLPEPSDSCPQFESPEPRLIPVGFQVPVSFQGRNLGQMGQSFSIGTELMKDTEATVTKEQGSKFRFPVVLYNCSVGREDCSLCKHAEAKYQCAWCAATHTCVYRDLCPSSQPQPQCPNPEITDIIPRFGPLNGRISVTIKGSNMGVKKEDIKQITVAGVNCVHQGDRYSVSTSVVCEIGPARRIPPSDLPPEISYSGAVEIEVEGGRTGRSQVIFTYRDPKPVSVHPARGPAAGGTVITITGEDLNTGTKEDVSVSVGGVPCEVLKFDSEITCKTGRYRVPSDPLTVTVKYGKNTTKDIPAAFQYSENPKITEFTPKGSFFCDRVSQESLAAGERTRFIIAPPKEREGGTFVEEALSKNDTILQFYSPAVNCCVDGQSPRTLVQLDDVQEDLKGFDYHPDPSFNDLAKNVITDETSIIIDEKLILEAPSSQPKSRSKRQRRDTTNDLLELVWVVGSVYYARKDNIPLAIIIPAVIVPMLLFIAVSVYCYRLDRRPDRTYGTGTFSALRKSQQAEREYEKVKHQLDNLMIEMEDHTSDLSEARIPFLDYKVYTDRNFFLPSKDGANDTMITGKIQIPEARKAIVAQALNQFSNLLNSKTFLINFIHTLESRPDFNARSRGYFASLLTVALHGKLEYYTDIMRTLLLELMDEHVKEKIIDQVYRNLPYSQRPGVESVALEWRPGSTGQILSDLDLTSQREGRWKRLNTLAHYNGCPELQVTQRVRPEYTILHQTPDDCNPPCPCVSRPDTEKCRAASETTPQNALLEDDSTFHLVRPADELDEGKSKRGSMKDKSMTKAITEIYLTRLLSVKLFLMCVHVQLPDPESVSVPSLPMRFWVNILRNPGFIFDVHVTEVVDASLHVIAQTFMDACTKTEHKLSRESPSNKLLYAKEISTYKKMVDDYYKGIRQMVPVSDQDMNTHLAEVSRQHTDKLNTQLALHQLYQYASKYYDVIIQSLDEDPAAQNKQLTLRLQQIAAALENKVTDL
ncbi:hypothetical protein FQN60_005938 [Etheostoma spectabile]|uniref:Plexin cytoplasmic RasGAP domain-containing protein n=1 Tax=Etheostoma spectabile TaxID=54343 RepID=A0A5J5CDT8_9PERO|nr:hypothetical protein FQN60_005629 [Etheostoma spectabile]KAA8580403.1 hypothetical protein FQN60_005938 [Etheostoma spectabile]